MTVHPFKMPEQVVPRILQLNEELPPAVSCLVRRFFAVQNPSQFTNLEGTESVIPMDCTSSSTFTDPSQTHLTFQLKVINPNPHIDFMNLGPGGVASFIEKIQIKSQGTTIEDIPCYGEVFENWLEVEGNSVEEFHMYTVRKSQMQTGWQWSSEGNINKVKMPMVDGQGKIMHACTVYNDSYPVGWQAHHILADVGETAPNLSTGTTPVADKTTYIERGFFTNDGCNYYYQPDGINPHCWPDTIGVEPPQFDVGDQVNNCGAKRPQDYFTFLANVKSIPIGCKSTISQDPLTGVYTVSSGSKDVSVTGRLYEQEQLYTDGEFTMQVCLPLVSGIIGLLARKAIPTFILSDLALHITWATAMKAAYYTMDPCRRIVGTRRDYCVWYGQVLGPIDGGDIISPKIEPAAEPQLNNFTDATTNQKKYGFVSQWALASNYMNGLQGSTFHMDTAYETPDLSCKGMLNSDHRAISTSALPQGRALGQGLPVTYQGDVGKGGDYPSFPYGGFISKNDDDGEGADPVARMAPMMDAPCLMNSVNPTWTSFLMQGKLPQYFIPSFYQSLSVYESPTLSSSNFTVPAVGKGSTELCSRNGGLAYTANMLPVVQVYGFDGFATSPAYLIASHYNGTPNVGNDAMGCYGTYLNASVPQTKRCFNNFGKASNISQISDPLIPTIKYPKYFPNQNTQPRFEISRLALVCHQLLLPDKVAAQVVAYAAQGNISIQTRFMKVYDGINAMIGNTSQVLAVPCRVGLANTITFLFRDKEQRDGPKQGMYHSTAGFNPFVKVKYTHDTYSFTGTNIPPEIVGMAASAASPTSDSSQWSAQLQIGGNYVPQQPITNCAELICEMEKASHSYLSLEHGRAMLGLVRNKALRSNRTTVLPTRSQEGDLYPSDVSSATDYTSVSRHRANPVPFSYDYHSASKPDVTEVDFLADNTFFTGFQDPDFLRDQTIINNSNIRYMTNAQNILEPTYTSWVPVAQGEHHINSFVTPRSKFFLSFDLDSFNGSTEVANSGTYLGIQQTSLRLEGAHFFTHRNVVTTAILDCQARLVIEAAGVMRSWV